MEFCFVKNVLQDLEHLLLCSTVMALLCIPVSELVSCTFLQSLYEFKECFHLLISTFFTCIQQILREEGLELLRLLTMELCLVKNVLQDLEVPCATYTTYHIT